MLATQIFETYTYDDYKNWEGDWELIGGVAYAMAPFALPSHQRAAVKIVKQLDDSLEKCSNCYALMESEVRFDNETVVRPDVMAKCGELDDISVTPNIVFEVVSNGSKKRDELVKFNLYMQEGILYYGLVYVDEKKVKIYKLIGGRYIKVLETKDGIFKTEDLECNIEINFSKVF